MPTLLHLDASPRGERSLSRRLSAAVVRDWQTRHPEGSVLRRDLACTPMTFVDLDWIAGAFSPPGQRTPGHEHALKISDELIAELFAADVIVLGMPMYNFSVPAVVKAWIDHLVRGGKTFRYTPTGPVGLAGGRTAVIALCSGQAYSAASGNDACNFAVPYLRHIFSFMGITDVRILHAEGAGRVAQGQISAEEFLAPYLAQAAQLAV